MASRVSLIQSRSIYVGTLNSVAPSDGNLIVTGNVGIGTTSPNFKLQVTGDFAAEDNIYLTDAGTVRGKFELNSSDTDDVDIKAVSLGSNMKFFTVDTERMRIDSSGNVGIGTTSPSQKLHVNGVIEAGPVSTAGGPMIYQSYASPNYIGSIGSEYSSGAMLIGYGATGKSGASGYVSTFDNFSGVRGLIRLSGGRFSILSTISAVSTATGGDLTMTTNFVVTDEGNVGIGTTAPDFKLDVNGDVRLGTSLLFSGTNSYPRLGRSTNDLTFQTSAAAEVMRITNAGNVGIGTTSPSTKLDVIGVGAFGTMNSSRGLYSNGLSIQNNTGEATSLFIWQSGVASAHIGSPANSTSLHIVNSYNTGLITDPNSIVLTNTGNVGIGTTAPSAKLHVAGGFIYNYGAQNVSGFKHENAGGGHVVILNANDSYAQLYTTGSTPLMFGTSNAERMRIDTSGNVGIGTTSPSYKFQVNASSYQAALINPGYGGWLFNVGTDLSMGFVLEGTGERMRLNSSGNLSIGNTNNTFLLDVGASSLYPFRALSSSGAGFQVNGSYIYADAYNHVFRSLSGTTTYATIDNNGNVGIGTTSPGAKLHVDDSSADAVIRISKGASTIGNIDLVNEGNRFSIQDDGVRRFVIDTSGNVGIGTTSPSRLFDVSAVNPQMTLKSTTTTGFSEYYFSDSAGDPGYLSYAHNGDYLSIGVNSAERIRITSAGNVGIGTTAPNAKLEANGAVTFANVDTFGQFVIKAASGATGNLLNFGVDTDTNISFIQSVNRGIDTTPLVLNRYGGNVGIGTTAPTYKLDVNGNARAGGMTLNAFATGTSGGNLELGFDGTHGVVQAYNRTTGWIPLYLSGDDIRFNPQGTECMRITSAGNVGIGTTSPTEKLHVDGNAVLMYNNSYQGINSVGNKAILARVSPTTGIINYAEYATAASLNGFVMGSDDARVKGNIATDSLEFITNGSTRVTVLSNGDVGIGTTSPTEKLQVNGSLKLDDGNADGPQLKLASSGYSDWNIDNFSGSLRAYYGSTEYTRLTSSGNFGIGVTPSYKLDVAGDTRITSGSLGVGVVPDATDGRIDASNDIVAYSSSDRRLKENITPIANALDKVKSLTGVEFDWRPEHKKAHGYEGHDTGVIAQEVQEVMPTAVRTNGTGYLAVRYEKLIGLLIEANKELAARVEELEKKLK